jgi:hypothetical protein
MLNGLPTNKWGMWLDTTLNELKESLKSYSFFLNSRNKIKSMLEGGWNMMRAKMVSNEREHSEKGASV